MNKFIVSCLVLGLILFSGCLGEAEREGEIEVASIESITKPPTPVSTASNPKSTILVAETTTTLKEVTPIPFNGVMDFDAANVVGVEFSKQSNGEYTFSVTVHHNDTGWDHYADWWRITDLKGREIARRVLTHPHENEQPFTRSLSGITIDPEITEIIVEAHDSVHGYGGVVIKLELATGNILPSNTN
jgi:hypothetical protein